MFPILNTCASIFACFHVYFMALYLFKWSVAFFLNTQNWQFHTIFYKFLILSRDKAGNKLDFL